MFLLKFLAIIWTAPNTLLGILLGLVSFPFGGKVRWIRGAIEFHGGLTTWILKKLPNNIHAMTLGHSIIGVAAHSLDLARDHEHVHIRQYERWGPFFIPAYLLSSLYMRLKGKDAYYDNPFEVEAYAVSSPTFDSHSKSDAEPESNDTSQ